MHDRKNERRKGKTSRLTVRGFLSPVMVIMGHSRLAFPTGIEVDHGQESTLSVSAFDFTGTDFCCASGSGSKIPVRAERALSITFGCEWSERMQTLHRG